MAAKLLHSLSDDNADLQRQIGCMTGIFQLFDRQQIITGRRIGGLSPKRLPSGSSRLYDSNFDAESNSTNHQATTKDNKPTKNTYEKQRASVESSRPSFSSSSRSSSFSSLDCNIKINQSDHSPYDRIIFPEIPSQDPSMRSSIDLRDVVKDSIYRDSWGLSVKTSIKDEKSNLLINPKDSPRQTLPSDLKESLRVLAKLREEHSRTSYISNDAPRFSYDSRERETTRSAPKNMDLPRLSLDSRERSFKNVGPSVVAKLMGLETFPDNKTFLDNKKFPDNFPKPIVLPVSLSTRKELASPRRVQIEPAPWKYQDGVRKPDFRNLKSPKRPNNSNNNINIPSVYSEIEKRLKDLEFTQSGKDLRALKQILESMQAKGILDNSGRREGRDGNFIRDPRPIFSKSPINARLVNKERAFESPIVIMKPAKLVSKSVISSSSMIPMDRLSSLNNPRGEKYLNNRKGLANNRASRDQEKKINLRENGNNPRPLKSGKSSIQRENNTSSASVSPRLQQKRIELEKRSRPPISPDSNKTRRNPIKNQMESSSPGGKYKSKITKKQKNDDQMSEVSSESKGLSYQEDDSEVSSSERFNEINGTQSPSLNAAKYAISGLSEQKFVPKLMEGELGELGSIAPEQPSPVSVLDGTMFADDALSPVKQRPDVLKDEMIFKENSNREQQHRPEECVSTNSTINRKKLENIENLVKKLRRVNSSHDETHTDYIASLCENSNPDHRYISEILLASGLLLRDLNSSLSIFQFHPSGYPINPELFLVLEQTKSSTLEKDHSGFGKIARFKCDKEKFHRKLIFDAVNEILVKKLSLMGASTNKLVRGSLSAQKLLRDLCCEIENIQIKKKDCVLEEEDDSLKSILCEDVMSRSENWTDFNGDLSGLVLDIERLLFKDLISEVVNGEAVRTRAGRRCRQLFA